MLLICTVQPKSSGQFPDDAVRDCVYSGDVDPHSGDIAPLCFNTGINWFFFNFGEFSSGLRYHNLPPQQIKARPAIHLPFNVLDSIDMTLCSSIAPMHFDPVFYSVNISI